MSTDRILYKVSKRKYIPVSCMVCATVSGWTCSKCHQGICHTCAYNVFKNDVFDPDSDVIHSLRPSWGKCPMCRQLLITVVEPAKLWVSHCDCGKPFAASTKEGACLLLEEHESLDCPDTAFAPCNVARKELAQHVFHCNKPDCLRMRRWIQEARRLDKENIV